MGSVSSSSTDRTVSVPKRTRPSASAKAAGSSGSIAGTCGAGTVTIAARARISPAPSGPV